MASRQYKVSRVNVNNNYSLQKHIQTQSLFNLWDQNKCMQGFKYDLQLIARLDVYHLFVRFSLKIVDSGTDSWTRFSYIFHCLLFGPLLPTCCLDPPSFNASFSVTWRMGRAEVQSKYLTFQTIWIPYVVGGRHWGTKLCYTWYYSCPYICSIKLFVSNLI